MMRPLVGASIGWLGLSMVADGVPNLLVPQQVLAEGGDATRVGLVTLVAIGLAAGVQPVAGSASDRVGRGPVVAAGVAAGVAGLLVLGAGQSLFGAVLALGGASIAQAGYQASMPDHVPPARRGRASGAKGLFDVGGAFIGFTVLAALLGGGQVAGAVVVLGVGLAASLAAGLVLLHGEPRARPSGEASRTAATVAPRLARLAAARFLFLLGIYAVGRFLLPFIADRLGVGVDAAAAQAGFALAVLALLTACAGLPAGWLVDRLGRRRLMLGGAGLAAMGIGGLTLATSLVGIVAFGILMALGSAAFSAGSWAALADVSEGRRAGWLLGMANIGTAGAAAAAGLFGPLIDAAARVGSADLGYAIAFGLAAACSAAGGLLAATLRPHRMPALAPAGAE
jgi:MFS family permease